MRDSNAALFGDNIISQTDEVYGLDEEGEINGSYRPSGYPGVRESTRRARKLLYVADLIHSYGLRAERSRFPEPCRGHW